MELILKVLRLGIHKALEEDGRKGGTMLNWYRNRQTSRRLFLG